MAVVDGNSKAGASLDKKTPEKKYVKKRPVPPLNELLAHGSEETRGQKKTWSQMLMPPLILAVLFFVSFLLFMQVFPRLPNNRNFQLPQRNQNTPRHSPSKRSDLVVEEQVVKEQPPQEEPREEKIINLAEVGL